MNALKDSFGQEVGVGDYVYFKVKTKYDSDAMWLGRITAISAKDTLSLVAINTGGKTWPEYLAYKADHRKRLEEYAAKAKLGANWVDANCTLTEKKRLATASSCVRVPPNVVSIDLAQALSSDG